MSGRSVFVDDSERQPLLVCECCGDEVVVIDSRRRCSC